MKKSIALALLLAVSGCVSTAIPLKEAVKKQAQVDDTGKQLIARQYRFAPGYSTKESRISYYVSDEVNVTACVKGVILSTSGASREVKVAAYTARRDSNLRTVQITYGGNKAVCDLPNLKWEPFPELGYYRNPS